MPKSKKPRKPKPLKKAKGPKSDQNKGNDPGKFAVNRDTGPHKGVASVQTPMHNRQPPQRGG